MKCWSYNEISIVQGHADVVKLLTNNDANVNHQDNRGLTPLFIAVQNRNLFETKIILAIYQKHVLIHFRQNEYR